VELTISQASLATLARQTDVSLYRRVLHQLDPHRFEALGEAHTVAFIRHALDRCDAWSLGMTNEAAYVLFLMTQLGSFFFEDPRYVQIAAPLLQDPGPVDRRVESARERFIAYGDRHYGGAYEARHRALRQLSARLGEFELPSCDPWQVAQTLVDLEARDEGLEALVERAHAAARELGMAVPLGEKLCVLLVYWLGWGVTMDPLFPWLRDLAAREGEPADAVARRLASAAKKRFYRRMAAIAATEAS